MIINFATPFVNLISFKRRANIQTNYCFNNSATHIIKDNIEHASKRMTCRMLH